MAPSKPFGEVEIRRIGRQVRSIREAQDLSQAALAEAAGVSERAIRDLETGRSNPTLATVAAIADVLDVALDDLVKAARSTAPVADYTAAHERAGRMTRLTRALPAARMHAYLLDLEEGADATADMPSGSLFAHVLDGSLTVTLDREVSPLREGDSLHARAGVMTECRGRRGGGRLLVVGTTSDRFDTT